LADDVATLVGWLRHDLLAVAGPCRAERCALYDFIVAERQARTLLLYDDHRADLAEDVDGSRRPSDARSSRNCRLL
jgi:hypothetical protein